MTEAHEALRRFEEEDPAGWSAYLAELRAWDAMGSDGLEDAAVEWPEYNTPEERATIGTWRRRTGDGG